MRNMRREYGQTPLMRADLLANPVAQFESWFTEIKVTSQPDPSAMVLSTIDANNRPDSRVVLLKDIAAGDFIFYTNYESGKAQQLMQCSAVALNFYWAELARQVRIHGRVEKISAAMSGEYFASRPLDSQLAALASAQSQVIANRKILEVSIQKLSIEYAEKQAPCPEYWGGYRVKPDEFEFWQGRDNRLHDRFRYQLIDKVWQIDRLAP